MQGAKGLSTSEIRKIAGFAINSGGYAPQAFGVCEARRLRLGAQARSQLRFAECVLTE